MNKLPLKTVNFLNPSSGSTQPVEGFWSQNLFIPKKLIDDKGFSEWLPLCSKLASFFPDSSWMITAIVRSWTGQPREMGGSHLKGLSCDLAPLFSKQDAIHPQLLSPRMADQRGLAAFVASIAPEFPFGLAMEGDHFHIDKRLKPGCYLYSTYRQEYPRDFMNKWLLQSPIHRRLFEAKSDGSIVPSKVVLY
jgi:hypothetical protein